MKGIFLRTACLALSVSVFGCGEGQGPRTVRFGSILDLTGPAASFGQMQRQGLELALEETQQSDCDWKVDLIIEDSRLEPRLALAAVNKLIEVDRVSAITSVTGSSMALTISPVAGRASVPIVDSLSSAPALSEEGGEYYFRIQPPDTYAGRHLVNWAGELGAQTVATVYADSDWGQGLREAIRHELEQHHLELVLEEAARPGEIDFRTIILRLRRADPDLLFLVAHPQEAGLFLRQASEAGLDVMVVGSDSLSTEEVRTAAGSALDGVLFALASEGAGPRLEDFRERFRRKYAEQPSSPW